MELINIEEQLKGRGNLDVVNEKVASKTSEAVEYLRTTVFKKLGHKSWDEVSSRERLAINNFVKSKLLEELPEQLAKQHHDILLLMHTK